MDSRSAGTVGRIRRALSSPVAACLALVAALVAGCGGGGAGVSTDDSTPSDFAIQADGLCVEAQAQLTGATEIGFPADRRQALELAEKVVPIQADLLVELDSIDPPDDQRGEWQRFLRVRRETLSLNRELAIALENERDDAARELGAQVEELGDRSRALASALGLRGCAGVLPRAARADIEAVITRVETVADPLVCAEAFTESYLERFAGRGNPVAACVRRFSRVAPALASVVESVRGTGPAATARSIPTGGEYDGEWLTYSLVKLGSSWRINGMRRDDDR
ncbi:MAG: hypothetical protein H0U42_07195 [Thermoleophilaceae bacterium]|nr:hypothetical protein [Thermoleophilaceae bacterium]